MSGYIDCLIRYKKPKFYIGDIVKIINDNSYALITNISNADTYIINGKEVNEYTYSLIPSGKYIKYAWYNDSELKLVKKGYGDSFFNTIRKGR